MAQKRLVTKIITRGLLIAAGIGVALGLSELGVRLMGFPYEHCPSYECNRMVGWLGTPNIDLEEEVDDYVHRVKRNSRGMHDRDHALEKPDGVYRILLVGDSFAVAREVEERETNHQVLEDTLNARAPDGLRFEVIVGGVRGWGPAQEYLYLREFGYQYQPDLVLVYWLPRNDLQDVLPDYRRTLAGVNCYAPYFAVCDGVFDPIPWFSAPGISPAFQSCSPVKKAVTNVLSWVYYRSRLYQYLERLTVNAHPQLQIDPWYLPWVAPEISGELLPYAYQVTGGTYDLLVETAAAHGAASVFVVLPTSETVLFETDPTFREEMLSVPGMSNSNPLQPNSVFRVLLVPTGAPILDLQQALVDYTRDTGEPLYWEEDGHWNMAGNRVAGEAIADWLIEAGLVPAAP